MVRRAKWTLLDQRSPGWELIGDRIDAGHIERFFDAHLGQNAGHNAGKQGLSRAGGTNHQDIVDKKPSHSTLK